MRERTFAALCTKISYADKPALCTCGYCWRSISSHLQRRLLGSAAHFTKPAVRTRRSGQISGGSSLRLVPTIKTWTFLLLARPQAVNTPGQNPLFGFSIGQRTQYQCARLINASVRIKTYKTAVSLNFSNRWISNAANPEAQ